MDRHDAEGDPTEALLPWHPVRDGAHLDGCEDGVSEGTVPEEVGAGADGVVVAHVLVDHEAYAGSFTEADEAEAFGVILSQRFLGKDSADLAWGLSDALDDSGLDVGRHRDVDNSHMRICDKVFHGLVDEGDPVLIGDRLCGSEVSTGDGNGVQSGGEVGGEVAFGEDESCAYATDANAEVFRERREVG
jgi:hypothetical protein